MSKLSVRIIADTVLFLSIFFVPWYIFMLLAVFFLFIFQRYYEAIFGGILIDILYGVPVAVFFGMTTVFTILLGVLYIVIATFKKGLR